MRFQRTITSCSVSVNAWPMCREPVTFGGGMTMENEGSRREGSALKKPLSSQSRYQRGSTAFGSYAFARGSWGIEAVNGSQQSTVDSQQCRAGQRASATLSTVDCGLSTKFSPA